MIRIINELTHPQTNTSFLKIKETQGSLSFNAQLQGSLSFNAQLQGSLSFNAQLLPL
jgi:hypothetical protein